MNILNAALKVLPIKRTVSFDTLTVFGRSVKVYKRQRKLRTEVTNGPCFRGVHVGLVSMYVAKKSKGKTFLISSDRGVMTVNNSVSI